MTSRLLFLNFFIEKLFVKPRQYVNIFEHLHEYSLKNLNYLHVGNKRYRESYISGILLDEQVAQSQEENKFNPINIKST